MLLTKFNAMNFSQNLEDVREEWEKVKFSYEILSDPKTRKNYDRNSSVAEVLDDPGGAVGRAVVGGTLSTLGMVLGGAWKLGEMATKKAYEAAVAEKEEKPAPKNQRETPVSGEPKIEAENAKVTPGAKAASTVMDSTAKMGTDKVNSIKSKPTPANGTATKPVSASTNAATTTRKISGVGASSTNGADMNTMKVLTPDASDRSKGTKKKKRKNGGGKGFGKN